MTEQDGARLVRLLSDMEEEEALALARRMLDSGFDPLQVLEGGIVVTSWMFGISQVALGNAKILRQTFQYFSNLHDMIWNVFELNAARSSIEEQEHVACLVKRPSTHLKVASHQVC